MPLDTILILIISPLFMILMTILYIGQKEEITIRGVITGKKLTKTPGLLGIPCLEVTVQSQSSKIKDKAFKTLLSPKMIDQVSIGDKVDFDLSRFKNLRGELSDKIKLRNIGGPL